MHVGHRPKRYWEVGLRGDIGNKVNLGLKEFCFRKYIFLNISFYND